MAFAPTSSTRMIRPTGRLRFFFGLPEGGGTGWFGCTGRRGGGVSPPLDFAGPSVGRSSLGSMRVGSGSSDPEGGAPEEEDFWPPYSQP